MEEKWRRSGGGRSYLQGTPLTTTCIFVPRVFVLVGQLSNTNNMNNTQKITWIFVVSSYIFNFFFQCTIDSNGVCSVGC